MNKPLKADRHIYAEGVGVGVVVAEGAGGEGALIGRAGGETGGAGGLGRANGLTGRAGGEEVMGRAGALAGVDALVGGAGASAGTPKGRTTAGGVAPVGADDVELLAALPLNAAAATGVAKEEGVEELLEELFEGAVPEMADWAGGGMSARTPESISRAD